MYCRKSLSLYISIIIIIISTQVGIGPFSARGNFSYANGSKSSAYTFEKDTNTVNIIGAQIIGWVCVLNPFFPNVDDK